MAATVNIAGLQNLAKTYQKDLRFLPYAAIVEVLALHGINLFPGIQHKDVIVTYERKRGIAKPYAVDMEISNSDLGKMVEAELEVKKAYASIKDNIQNYVEKNLVTPGEMIGSNQTKKHPFQMQMMSSVIKTFGEDIIDALFPGKRDETDQSPTGCFDGFDTLIDNAIVAGKIAAGNGNYIESGDFVAPTTESDYEAYTHLIEWLRQADNYLLKNGILLAPRNVIWNIKDAFENKFRYKDMTIADLEARINEKVSGNIKLVSSLPMGSGDRIQLVAPNNMDFGMNSLGDQEFVQVIPPAGGQDPNGFYFWLQADYGTRYRSFNKKVFLTNEGTPESNPLSGDYIS